MSARLLSSFWLLQLGGWGAYAFVKMAGRNTPRDDAIAIIAYVIAGLVCTLPLRAWYRRVRRGSPTAASVVVAVLSGSVVATVLWILSQELSYAIEGRPTIASYAAFMRSFMGKAPLILAWSALYFAITHWQDLERERTRTLRALADAREAQLQMLRYQLQPHFLFNALNSLRALIDEDPRKAREMVTLLSGFLRYSLLPSSLTEVSLEEELESVRQYLAIEQIRFEQSLAVRIDVDPEAARRRVPSFLLHPLVENAIKHGRSAPGEVLQLTIDARTDGNGTLDIAIANTGRLASTNGGGVGLANVRARLEHSFPGLHAFTVDQDDGWVRARLVIHEAPHTA